MKLPEAALLLMLMFLVMSMLKLMLMRDFLQRYGFLFPLDFNAF